VKSVDVDGTEIVMAFVNDRNEFGRIKLSTEFSVKAAGVYVYGTSW
jgi:hypothetical protein